MDDIRNLKKQLSKEFDMKDMGPTKKILGMQITKNRQRGELQLSQAEYINHVLQWFNMANAKPVSIPLASHEGTDIVLIMFLKAKHYKLHEAFGMLRRTLRWQELLLDVDKMVYIHSADKKGYPLYCNIHEVLKEKHGCREILGTVEGREKLLRSKIQYIEKGIRQLSFRAGGPEMKELRLVSKKAFMLFQIIISVPFWFYALHFVAAKESSLSCISPENLPVEYGGLYVKNDPEFFPEDKPQELEQIQAARIRIMWDLSVVPYKEQFIPDDEGSYKIQLQRNTEKRTKESVRNSFYVTEAGKIVITIVNATLKKKRVYYRSKTF
ncbi:hypothetical protein K2173_013713 [Erythroxylum novogranatense]|uniref:Reverse transcriptase Ty1/copia-type domain-containing protein n=1 Tax=Erythroxylum novogranatense TaxID=1862640 RepID=A0AAV8SA61_9ROSI|nr:hypothetical protein K2173_013713 [Erythroxylum novogranatense]